MAVLNVLIDRDPEQVWDVLCDGWAYAEWVVGTQHIRHVDRDWPAESSQIHYVVGLGRLTIEQRDGRGDAVDKRPRVGLRLQR